MSNDPTDPTDPEITEEEMAMMRFVATQLATAMLSLGVGLPSMVIAAALEMAKAALAASYPTTPGEAAASAELQRQCLAVVASGVAEEIREGIAAQREADKRGGRPS